MKLLYTIFLYSIVYASIFILPSNATEEKVFIAVVGGTSFGAPEKFGEGLTLLRLQAEQQEMLLSMNSAP